MHAACKGGIPLNFEDRVEQLFQAPCWVIDPLPFQVNGPVPACAMGDKRIAFMYQKNTGLIELVENPM